LLLVQQTWAANVCVTRLRGGWGSYIIAVLPHFLSRCVLGVSTCVSSSAVKCCRRTKKDKKMEDTPTEKPKPMVLTLFVKTSCRL
ncbi:unnamed protein product, partial [Amoebophrya sp. A25]